MKNNKVLKAGIWYTISNFIVKGLTFITMPIFTHLLTKSDIGLFSNITSWFSIFAIITSLELYSSLSIARFDYKKDLNSYINSTLVLGTIITIVFYILCLIFHTFIEKNLLIDFTTLNIMFIYLLVYPSFQMFQLSKQFDYDYKQIIITSMLSALSTTILSIILVLLFNNKLYGRILGYFIPLILISLFTYIYLINKSKNRKISTKYWKYALKVSMPLVLHLLAGYLLNSSDKIMITKMISPDANAFYSVSYSLSMIVSLLWTSMNNAWSPWAYQQMDSKQYENLKNASKPYFIFFMSMAFVMMIIAPELLYIMAGSTYLEAKYVMPPVMVGYIFQFVYSLYVNIEFYHKKQKNIALGTIIAALINIILNFIFIPKYGYIAAAYTTLIGYIILFAIHYFFVKKLKCASWYDTKFFLIFLIISIIYMFICNALYSLTLFRYLIVFLIIINCLLLLKNKYITFFNERGKLFES